jgi:hypothetical protein
MIDFDSINTTLKDAGEGQGFKYVHLQKWANVQLNVAPAQWVDKGFTVRYSIDADQQNKTQNDKWYILRPEPEFMLDLMNDNYLEKVGEAITAVKAMRDALSTSSASYDGIFSLYSDWKSFTTVNFDRHLIVTFNNCYLKIREA